VISGAFNNKSVHFVGVIIVWQCFRFSVIFLLGIFIMNLPQRI
jgi:hypothetical protein